jgi:ABC-type Fe3+/spermidine/putrescine transport system ATPase subunit
LERDEEGTREIATAIRPERILLENDAGGAPNSLAGIVDDLAFRGSDTLYRVRLESGTILRVVASNSGGRDAYRPGDRVHVRIPPEACIPLSH